MRQEMGLELDQELKSEDNGNIEVFIGIIFIFWDYISYGVKDGL